MYVIVTHDEARGQLRELPDRVVTQYLEVRAALETSPWTAGRSSKPSNPNANIFTIDIADSDVTVWYAIAERDREVHILEVLWL